MACRFTVPPLQVAAVETDGLRTEARPRAFRLKDFGAGPGQYHVNSIGSDLPPLGSNLSAPLDAPSLDLGQLPARTSTQSNTNVSSLPSAVPKLSYSTGLSAPQALTVGQLHVQPLSMQRPQTINPLQMNPFGAAPAFAARQTNATSTRVTNKSSPTMPYQVQQGFQRVVQQQVVQQVVQSSPPARAVGAAATNGNTSGVVSNKEDKLMSLKYHFQGGDFQVNGEPLTLQALHPTDQGETGWRVWDAGIVLSKFAEQNFVGKQLKVLELGCGTGISGISFALCGSEVILSDKEVIRQRTESNIGLNQQAIQKNNGSCKFMSLDWNDLDNQLHRLPKDIDMIISSDVIWADVFINPFLNTVQKICQYLDNVPVILFSHKTRVESVDQLFFQTLPQYGFVVSDTITSEEVCAEEFQHPKIKIYCFEEQAGAQQSA